MLRCFPRRSRFTLESYPESAGKEGETAQWRIYPEAADRIRYHLEAILRRRENRVARIDDRKKGECYPLIGVPVDHLLIQRHPPPSVPRPMTPSLLQDKRLSKWQVDSNVAVLDLTRHAIHVHGL